MIRKLRTLLRATGLDERRCTLCLSPFYPAPAAENRLLCPDCEALLRPRAGGFCPRCGALFAREDMPVHLCATCLRRANGAENAPAWDRVLFHGPYDGALRRLLLDFKFKNRFSHLRLLRFLARQTLTVRLPPDQRDQWDLVAPVPLHVRRLRKRGFNQSLELARAAARTLAAPLRAQTLRRLRDTRPQFTQRKAERITNIKNAFAADQALVRGKRVLLVDDIMTTGATVNEAARCLCKGGARRVDVLVLARAED